MPQLSHDLDDADRVTAVSADVAGERQGNGKAALGEGFPVTGVVFRHARGRRLVAHGGEKGTVRATENVEPEKLSRCVHLSPCIDFCGLSSTAQYTGESIGGKRARQPRSGSQEERAAAMRSQEVHYRIALLVAAPAPEMDRYVPVGTHGNGVCAPKICRSCGGHPGSQITSGIRMSSDQCPNRQ